jgi:hypothetical protein
MLLEIKTIIKEECARHGLDHEIIQAIAEVESGGVGKAARYEKHYAYYYKDAEFAKLQKITLETERAFQKTSWGVLQLMGGTARWIGYSSWLPDLCDPRVGILWGCMYYKRVCDKHLYLNEKIASFNAGSIRKKADGTLVNQAYVDKVLAALGQIQTSTEKAAHLS